MQIDSYFCDFLHPAPPTQPLAGTRQAWVLTGNRLNPKKGPEAFVETMSRWGFFDLGLPSTGRSADHCWVHPRGVVVIANPGATEEQDRLVVMATLDMGRYRQDKDTVFDSPSQVSQELVQEQRCHDLDGVIYQHVVLECSAQRLKPALVELQRLGRLADLNTVVRVGRGESWPAKTKAFSPNLPEGWDLSTLDLGALDPSIAAFVCWMAAGTQQDPGYQNRMGTARRLVTLVQNIAKQKALRYGKGEDHERLKKWCLQASGERAVEMDHSVLSSGLTQAVCLASLPGEENNAMLTRWIQTAPMESLLQALQGTTAIVPPLMPLVVYGWGCFERWASASQESVDPFASSKAAVSAAIERVGDTAVYNTWVNAWSCLKRKEEELGGWKSDVELARDRALYPKYSQAVVWLVQEARWCLPCPEAMSLLREEYEERMWAPIQAWIQKQRLEGSLAPTKASPRTRL